MTLEAMPIDLDQFGEVRGGARKLRGNTTSRGADDVRSLDGDE